MKTLADFKRTLQIGSNLHCIYHQDFVGCNDKGQPIYKDLDKGIRKVSIKQTNSFALKDEKTERDIWCNFPKAKECIIKGNSITILEKDTRGIKCCWEGNKEYDNAPLIPILTYTFID